MKTILLEVSASVFKVRFLVSRSIFGRRHRLRSFRVSAAAAARTKSVKHLLEYSAQRFWKLEALPRLFVNQIVAWYIYLLC